ncbi:MAG: geranylgeranylglyceryl/heptaprenylglyceryl phosphate synthase [Bacteroidota bacterium]
MIYDHLLSIRAQHGAGFIVLIDPDKLPPEHFGRFVDACEPAGADAFFVGGSLMHAVELDQYIERLKQIASVPVIGFPGSLSQISPHLDALLYLSVISGRNPDYLFGRHVHAAPVIRRLGLEPIPTGYMLIESGRTTTAQYMSGSAPIPHHKPEIAAATGLAAEMMGMKLLYTDAGSGAEQSVSDEMVYAITKTCTVPLVVGGGLRTPEAVARKVHAGAGFIVVGNAIEQRADAGYIAELAAAAHSGSSVPVSK